MNVRWKKLLVTTILWLVAEIWFNFLGIDDLVDYAGIFVLKYRGSEFIKVLNH